MCIYIYISSQFACRRYGLRTLTTNTTSTTGSTTATTVPPPTTQRWAVAGIPWVEGKGRQATLYLLCI